jgi:hypothetical protein
MMSRGALPLLGALLLGCSFVAAARAAFGIAVLPATVTSSALTLNGVDQTSSFTATVTVSGATNTGWNLTAWAPLPVSGANTLGALVVATQPTLGACSGSGCNLPTPTGITWPVTLGTTSGTASKIYNANVSTGVGTNTVTITFKISVVAKALPGSYTTTLTVIGSSTGP